MSGSAKVMMQWAPVLLSAYAESRMLHATFLAENCLWPDPYGVTSIHILPEEPDENSGWVDDS